MTQRKQRNSHTGTQQSPVADTSPAAIDRLDDIARAVQLRAAGMTFEKIGEEFGVHRSTVHRWIVSHLEAAKFENATLLRTQEGERLDRLQAAVWQRALRGNLLAIDRVLKIMDRRAKLFGLDQPLRIAADVTVEQSTSMLEAKVAAIAQRRSEAIDVEAVDG